MAKAQSTDRGEIRVFSSASYPALNRRTAKSAAAAAASCVTDAGSASFGETSAIRFTSFGAAGSGSVGSDI